MILTTILALQAASATLTLDFTQPGVEVSPTLYGLMTEEINFSYEGGLYGELLRNRTFKDQPATAHWNAVGDGSSLVIEKGGEISLRVRGNVANTGYWGIPVRPGAKYRLTLVAKTASGGPVTARIESSDGVVYAQTEIKGLSTDWQKLSCTLEVPQSAKPTAETRLVLSTSTDHDTWVRFASLMQPTYKGRPNGNRSDLMKLLVEMKPKFLRFPGGNYLEGNTIAERFNWKDTLGLIEERPGHRSPWGYLSTDGMGLLEFLNWSEDMKAEPLLAVYAGYSLGGQVTRPGADLEGYVQDALDEIEYVIGGKDTTWGGRRVKDGHPKPFPLHYVEVGNEDGFDRSGTYPARFSQFSKAIHAKYPNLKVISTTGGKDYLGARFPIVDPKPEVVDEHYYAGNWEMMSMATKYDSYDRKGPRIFVGEWASQGTSNPWERRGNFTPTPDMASAVSDAAFLTGLERNSDVVCMSCYAPLLVNVNPGGRQWPINLIGYNALSSFGSPSYYAQRMFGANVGNRTVACRITGAPEQTNGKQALPGLFASVTRDTKTGKLFIKIVNALPTSQEVRFDLRGAKIDPDGALTVLTGKPDAVNTIAEPTKVAPKTTRLSGLGSGFSQSVPPCSVIVITARVRL